MEKIGALRKSGAMNEGLTHEEIVERAKAVVASLPTLWDEKKKLSFQPFRATVDESEKAGRITDILKELGVIRSHGFLTATEVDPNWQKAFINYVAPVESS